MKTYTEVAAGILAGRMSRRGMLAWCGKLALAAGVALTGMSMREYEARAACCSGTPCTGNCNTGPCPSGCSYVSDTTCCEAGNLHICVTCDCMGGICVCETDSGPDPRC